MNSKTSLVTKIASLTLLLSASAMAENTVTPDDGLADMSDPLAVFTMAAYLCMNFLLHTRSILALIFVILPTGQNTLTCQMVIIELSTTTNFNVEI